LAGIVTSEAANRWIAVMPEGRSQFLTHRTEELMWRDPFLDHTQTGPARSSRYEWRAVDPGGPE
jgi:hypothetical protein